MLNWGTESEVLPLIVCLVLAENAINGQNTGPI